MSEANTRENIVLDAPASNPLIQVKGLRKVYQVPGGEVVALDGIDLNIERGSIYGIIGMSGAGKSTLIRCLNKLDTPTDGQILIDGRNILSMNGKQLMAMRRKVSMIFQSFNLLMQKTVAQNVRYPLDLAGTPRARANERVKELLTLVELDSKADAYPIQLSGGQRQRVAIARALSAKAPLIMADEPTANLDSKNGDQILQLMKKLNKELNTTFVFSTHDQKIVSMSDHVIHIKDGVITGQDYANK